MSVEIIPFESCDDFEWMQMAQHRTYVDIVWSITGHYSPRYDLAQLLSYTRTLSGLLNCWRSVIQTSNYRNIPYDEAELAFLVQDKLKQIGVKEEEQVLTNFRACLEFL